MARRELKPVIKCRRCKQELPLEDRLLDWMSGTGSRRNREYLKPVPWCEPCYEKEVEAQEIKELESWPDLEETLEIGLQLVLDDDPEYHFFDSPEGRGMMRLGEVTKW